MKRSVIPINLTTRALRQFAAAWLILFLAFGTHQYLVRGHHQFGLALGLAAVAVGLPGLIWPVAIRWLFVGWMVLAFPIGWLISQITLILLFYGVITPIAVFFRWRGRDVLRRKPAPDRATFWTPKHFPKDMRSYFHQY